MGKNKMNTRKALLSKSNNIFSALLLAIISVNFLCGSSIAGEAEKKGKGYKFICVKEAKGAPITAIAAYDNDRMAIAGDKSGNLYRLDLTSDNSIAVKLNSDSYAPIEFITAESPIGDFCFMTGGRVYEYKKDKALDITGNIEGKIKALYFDKDDSRLLYAITENDQAYFLSEEDSKLPRWVPLKDSEAEDIILEDINREKKKDSNLLKNIDKVFLREIGAPNIASCGGNLLGISDGKVYAKNYYAKDNEESSFKISCKYTSDAVGYADKAVYRVTIEGKKLNTDDIFITGLNGFKYKLSATDSSGENVPGYDMDAYPVNGAIYTTDSKDEVSLENREISFLWLGPKCSRDGQYELKVSEIAYNFSANLKSDKIKEIGNRKIKLLAPIGFEKDQDYSSHYKIDIRFEENSFVTESNGTCAIPFNVLIVKDNKPEPELATDPIYNRLVFYSLGIGSSPNKDGIIGCDPYRVESAYTAIQPASSTEYKSYIKYGTKGVNCKTSGGRTFYAYTTAIGSHNMLVGLVSKKGDKYKLAPDKSLILNGVKTGVTLSYAKEMNFPGGRTFSISGGSGSNWQGNEWGLGGLLDYQLTNYGNDVKNKENAYKGVFVYLPEGLNIRKPKDRKDLRSSQLEIGYYFDPQENSESPLLATNYKLNDTPSWCDKMRGQNLHALLFDQYGRAYDSYTEQKDLDKTIIDNRDLCLWENRDLKWNATNREGHKLIINIANFFKTPIVMGSTSDSYSGQYGVTERGLFVPPITSGVNASFMSMIPCFVNFQPIESVTSTIEGYPIVKSKERQEGEKKVNNRLFYNSLNIIKKTDGWGHWITTDLTVRIKDGDKTKLVAISTDEGKKSSDVVSLNTMRIEDIHALGPAYQDSWTVTYLPTERALGYRKYYSYTWRFEEHEKRSWVKGENMWIYQQDRDLDVDYFNSFYAKVQPHRTWGQWFMIFERGVQEQDPFDAKEGTKPSKVWPISRTN